MKAKKENQKEGIEATSSSNETISGDETASELNAPRWSVVSFDGKAASNLTYDKAAAKLKELEAQKIVGLCIVTDETAERIGAK